MTPPGVRLRSEYDVSDADYFAFRDHIAGDIRRGLVGQRLKQIYEAACDRAWVTPGLAAAWTERLARDLTRENERRQTADDGQRAGGGEGPLRPAPLA